MYYYIRNLKLNFGKKILWPIYYKIILKCNYFIALKIWVIHKLNNAIILYISAIKYSILYEEKNKKS